MSELREQLRELMPKIANETTMPVVIERLITLIEQREVIARLKGRFEEHRTHCAACSFRQTLAQCEVAKEFLAELSKLRGGDK